MDTYHVRNALLPARDARTIPSWADTLKGTIRRLGGSLRWMATRKGVTEELGRQILAAEWHPRAGGG